MDFLPFLNESVVLRYSLKSEFFHQIDFIRVINVFPLQNEPKRQNLNSSAM